MDELLVLTYVNTTNDANGYLVGKDVALGTAIVGFRTFKGAQEFADSHDRQVVLLTRRDEMKCWYTNGESLLKAPQLTEKDFGGIRVWRKGDETKFFSYVKDLVGDCETYDEMEDAVVDCRNMYDAIRWLKDGEILVEFELFDYVVHEEFPVRWRIDRCTYMVGVV